MRMYACTAKPTTSLGVQPYPTDPIAEITSQFSGKTRTDGACTGTHRERGAVLERIFRDRQEAGRLLGERLAELGSVDWADALVLGIPRGGVIVAAAAAERVGAELDILVPAKIRAPQQPELA